MPERISITYTIDLQDLEKELERLYRSMLESLSDLSDSCIMPDSLLGEPTIRELSDISQSLRNISFKISDIESIVKSYLNYITRPPESNDSQQLENLQNLAKTLSNLNNEDTAM